MTTCSYDNQPGCDTVVIYCSFDRGMRIKIKVCLAVCCLFLTIMPPSRKRKAASPVASNAVSPAPSAPAGSFVACPTCGKSFSKAFIHNHAWRCNSGPTSDANGATSTPTGAFIGCPTCTRSFPWHVVQEHAWSCSGINYALTPQRKLPTSASMVDVLRAHGTEPVGHEGSRAERTQHTRLPGSELNDRNLIEQLQVRVNENLSSAPSGPSPTTCGQDGFARSSLEFEGVRRDGAKFTMMRCRKEPVETDTRTGRNDAIQKIMDGGKRAMKVEKEAKTVPRNWPVELVEDILPTDQANKLLACLLEVSHDWTSYPWYNNNGVEGRSHSRSCIYRLNAKSDIRRKHSESLDQKIYSGGNTMNDDSMSHAAGVIPTPPSAGNSSSSGRPSPSSSSSAREDPGMDHVDIDIHTDSECREHEDARIPYTPEHATEAPPTKINGSTIAPFPSGEGWAGRIRSEPTHVGRASYCKMTAGAEIAVFAKAESKHESFALTLDEQQDVAPPELLEVVPTIVDAVRRRQRQRVDEGLGGEDNLDWNPNFCICHIYDDHRSRIGAHSDTLSNIGPNAIVTGISLGAKRAFMVQETLPWGTKAPPASDWSGGGKKMLDMPHNSAVVMWGGCQERYKHSVPALSKGVEIHPLSGTKRISITLRERKEKLPSYLLPIPECRCRVPATLKARVLANGNVEYVYICDRGQGQCGFWASKALARY